MALALDHFVRRLVESTLLAEADVQAFVDTLPGSHKPADGEQLARLLVKHKKLTAYQAQEIYKGAGKNLVLGNYVILDKLGQGGMGMVLKAEHKRMKRIVAVKVLSAAALKSPEAVARFHREVEAAARLEHPNIVAAHDADEAHGTHFLVMQFVDGSDLASLVKRSGPLPVERALNCIIQAGRGLEFAHQEGVIHRDVKPANLLLDNKGTVKVLDMGLARFEASAPGGGAPELTGTGQIMGTVDYMAPEQAVNTKHADQRADIYSLGISLWYLLTGKVAYDGETLMERILGHQNKPIPSLRQACPDVSAKLDAVFHKMVAKQPADRYQSMTEVLAALSHCVPAAGGSAPSVTVLPGEDSRLSEFLRANPAPGTASRSAPLPAAVQAIDQAALTLAPEATLNVSAQSEDTEPKSNVSLPESVGNALRGASSVGNALRGASSVGNALQGVPAVTVPASDDKAVKRSTALLSARLIIGIVVAAGLLLLLLPLGIWLLTRDGKTAKIEIPEGGSGTLRKAPEVSEGSGPPMTSGKFALEFDGQDDFVELPTLRYEGRHSVTIEALVTPARIGETEVLMQLCGTHWMSLATRGDGWGAVIHGPQRSVARYGGGVLSPGRRDHVAAVFDLESVRLYVNGQSSGTMFPLTTKRAISPVSAIASCFDEALGAKRERFFAGRVDGLRISKTASYDKPFTAPTVLEKDANTLALYQFDEGQGTELKDSSGNNHHGKIIGAKWVLADGKAIPQTTRPAGN